MKGFTMEKNEKIVALATVAVVAGSAVAFAIKAKQFRTRWTKANERIDALELTTETPTN
jgi:hypothetical protein